MAGDQKGMVSLAEFMDLSHFLGLDQFSGNQKVWEDFLGPVHSIGAVQGPVEEPLPKGMGEVRF